MQARDHRRVVGVQPPPLDGKRGGCGAVRGLQVSQLVKGDAQVVQDFRHHQMPVAVQATIDRQRLPIERHGGVRQATPPGDPPEALEVRGDAGVIRPEAPAADGERLTCGGVGRGILRLVAEYIGPVD